MRELEAPDLVYNVEEKTVDTFFDKINSKMKVKTEYHKDYFDEDWLDIFEEAMEHLEKICRNPKKFITTEEEIVKIEASKKTGVESIKHLAKHTNLVQDIDENGDIIPSKILNVFKEETFNTYENRFIYTLIFYMLQFIRQKGNIAKEDPRLIDNKSFSYVGKTKLGDENINATITLQTMLDVPLNKDPHYEQRIDNLNKNVRGLQFTEMYKALENEGVPHVTNPIKKTNVILKNTDFQYAMKLWDYIHIHMLIKGDAIDEKKDYYTEARIKKYVDETFLLDYLTIDTLSKKDSTEDIDKTKERMTNDLLDKIIELNPDMTLQQLLDKLGRQFDYVKKVKFSSKKDIEKIFRKYLDKYLSQVNNIKF